MQKVPRFTGATTALLNTSVRGRSYAPKGQTPVALTIGGTRHKFSMIASVTNQGKARWLIVDGKFNHERLIQFVDLLIKDTPRKVFLTLDNLGVCHREPVQAWLAAHGQQIEEFYLPNHSPELNSETCDPIQGAGSCQSQAARRNRGAHVWPRHQTRAR
jgi:hypothetical protein